MRYNGCIFRVNLGVWRSWLARAVWDREVEGSSPFTPTIEVISDPRHGIMAWIFQLA